MRFRHFTIKLAVLAVLLPSFKSYADDAIVETKPLHQVIDEQVQSGFSKWPASPAERSSDAEFLRRIFLDLTGTIPDSRETTAFIASKDAGKRKKLIDKLLASDAFARHISVVFDVMLMERRPDKYVTTVEWQRYLEDSFARNKPLDSLVRDILRSDGVDLVERPAAKFYLDRAVDKDTLVRDIGRLFLGVDLQCAQCHDHPSVDDYLHEHYYGLSVFVAGSKTFKQADGKMVLQETALREVEFVSVFDPDTTRKTGPRLIDALMKMPAAVDGGEVYVKKPSRTVRSVPKFSLRQLLADKLPSNQTPEFSRNMSNRLWAMMMGRGIVHPLDMHHTANPPSHPKLLELLANQLKAMKYDTRAFLRELAISEAYQRSSMIPNGAKKSNVPPESFAVANMKGLSPEQLFASLLTATDSHQLLNAQIESELTEDADAYEALSEDKDALNKARATKKRERLKEFVALFGSVSGRAEGEFQASLPHALFISNSKIVMSWVHPGHGNLTARLLKMKDTKKLVAAAYVSVLSRMPLEDELNSAVEYLTKRPDDRSTSLVQFVWSLVASAEFRLNH